MSVARIELSAVERETVVTVFNSLVTNFEKHKIKTLVLSFLVFKLIADYNVFRLITIAFNFAHLFVK